MPKLPIAVAISKNYDPTKGNAELRGLVVGSDADKVEFLDSLGLNESTNQMSVTGRRVNRFISLDGTRHTVMDANYERTAKISSANTRDVQYILLFDKESVNKVKKLGFDISAINYNNAQVTLEKLSNDSLNKPATTVVEGRSKKVFNNMLETIDDKLRKLSLINRFKPKEKIYSLKAPTLFNSIPTKPVHQESNLLADWNRLGSEYTPLSIDGVLIQDILKKERGEEVTPGNLFSDMNELEDFFKKHLLKNVKPAFKEAALAVLTEALHQGAWQRPMTAAAFIAVRNGNDFGPRDAMSNKPDDVKQRRVTNFNTSAQGFAIEDEVIQYQCAYTIESDNAGDLIFPDEGKDFIYHAKVKIDLDFNSKLNEGPWPKVELSKQSVEFGNEEVRNILEQPGPGKEPFLVRVLNYLKELFTLNRREPAPTMKP